MDRGLCNPYDHAAELIFLAMLIIDNFFADTKLKKTHFVKRTLLRVTSSLYTLILFETQSGASSKIWNRLYRILPKEKVVDSRKVSNPHIF